MKSTKFFLLPYVGQAAYYLFHVSSYFQHINPAYEKKKRMKKVPMFKFEFSHIMDFVFVFLNDNSQ